jgi:hypothetical protein
MRVTPASPASPAAPVVVTFDHPVAPRLGESVDPATVIRVAPAVGQRVHWRDPSTFVVEFDSLWSAGATYRIELDAGLRSASGLPIARSSRTREIRVAPSSVIAAAGSLSGGEADTLPRPVIVVSAPMSTGPRVGSSWLVPRLGCSVRDSIPLRVTSSRPIRANDPPWIQEAGGYGRERRTDSLRRVVELEAARALPFGCVVDARYPELATVRGMLSFRVRPRFAMIEASACSAVTGRCVNGPLAIRFNQSVPAGEIRAHVRVDGRAVTLADKYDRGIWVILPDARPSSRHQITVSGALRSARGERLGADTS